MLRERVEAKWIDLFARTFELAKLRPGDDVAILSETQSRQINVQLAELALLRLKAKPFHIVMPTPPVQVRIPVRSTGATRALQGVKPVVGALSSAVMVVDLTVEGLMHAPETPAILEAGSRILYISNDHPEQLERCAPDPAMRERVHLGVEMAKSAKQMHVTSRAGTDLVVDLRDAFVGGTWGGCDTPGTLENWPGGAIVCFPKGGTVNGTLVMDIGDFNCTFKRNLERPVSLKVEKDFAVAIEGEGLDAELMRSYFAAWNDKNAYASSHVGWGMNQGAFWDAMIAYDKADTNAVEQRVFGGNFLYSTGANPFADRFTLGHFDLPMRNCTVALDGTVVVKEGVLQGRLAA